MNLPEIQYRRIIFRLKDLEFTMFNSKIENYF